jgi:hypothetical protein
MSNGHPQSLATMPTHPAPHNWRRYLRFSVRGLIVFVIVVGAALGWVVHQAHLQRDAVEAIRMAASAVKYDVRGRESLDGANERPGNEAGRRPRED